MKISQGVAGHRDYSWTLVKYQCTKEIAFLPDCGWKHQRKTVFEAGRYWEPDVKRGSRGNPR